MKRPLRSASSSGFAAVLVLTPVVGLALAVGGCGNSRTPVPSLTAPAAANGFRTLSLPAGGVRLDVPRNWAVVTGNGSLLATISSGAAIVALWRYPRHRGAPAGTGALATAGRELVAQARRRDPGFRTIGVHRARIDGRPAIVVDGVEQVGGHQRRVSSTHVFERGAELVLDEYAPVARFGVVQRSVFGPLRRSLSLVGAGV